MNKLELFSTIIDEVCCECLVNRADVINNVKLQSVVDARVLCVQYMRRIGLSNDDIAQLALHEQYNEAPTAEQIKQKARSIDKMFKSYSDRCLQSDAFCIFSQDIAVFIERLREESRKTMMYKK